MSIWGTVSLFSVVIIVSMHICNILLIIKTKKLHKPSYFLIIHLSIGDLILTLTAGINVILFGYRNEKLYVASDICYNVSNFYNSLHIH